VTGALWAAASGIGFGLFQSINRLAVRDLDAYVSTFLQVTIAFLVLFAISLATEDPEPLLHAGAWPSSHSREPAWSTSSPAGRSST
jgi:drug/metabolite transporter (DMT)-like permease